MTTKHTNGPLFIARRGDWDGMSGVSLGIDDEFGQDGGRDYYLATVVHGDPDELAANATLFRAAPDMIAALHRVRRYLRSKNFDPGMRDGFAADVEAVIHYATTVEPTTKEAV